ncbi:hypothetical protein Taro_026181 [Colocasia esculenta]|uniref:Uncharacterized protein n=1 Tax=Colocasia esculenta TaxID=4460 RepID=A0A843VC77_COLES|nr:hypothetical protein [Colocasia esculenta]
MARITVRKDAPLAFHTFLFREYHRGHLKSKAVKRRPVGNRWLFFPSLRKEDLLYQVLGVVCELRCVDAT